MFLGLKGQEAEGGAGFACESLKPGSALGITEAARGAGKVCSGLGGEILVLALA